METVGQNVKREIKFTVLPLNVAHCACFIYLLLKQVIV
jgi:hypothetical protein